MNGDEREQLTRGVDSAVRRLIDADSHLLTHDVNERSLTHKLAEYLQSEFREWNVDCEYNRDHENPKVLDIVGRDARTDDTNAQTVFPDVIVHRRGTDENLLVIEVKKTTSRTSDHHDLAKLDAFLRQLHYRHALFLKFETGTEFSRLRYRTRCVDSTSIAPHFFWNF